MMKPFLLLLLTIIYLPQSYAFLCRNIETGTIYYGDSKEEIIDIPIEDNLQSNEENIFVNIADYIECWNEAPSTYIDYLETEAAAASPGSVFNNLTTGLYLNGSRYLSNSIPKTNVFKIDDDNYHPINMELFFVTPKAGNYFSINKGDRLMTIRLKKFAYDKYDNVFIDEDHFMWTFVASNSATLKTGSCTINNNEVINVDFGYVPKSKVKNAGQGLSSITKELDLFIDCEDPNLNNQAIQLTLKADTSPFSTNAIVTTLSDGSTSTKNQVGIELYHNNTLIRPNSNFKSILNQGMAQESLLLSLIKSPNVTNDALNQGDFHANASLIISTP